MDGALQLVIGAIVGYLLGMIPTGAIVGRRFGLDLRQVGSGSTGATNVLRTLGKKWAALVALIDVLKGAVAVFLVGLIFAGAPADRRITAQVVTAAFAVLGHTYSPLLGFRGGRGILTGGGGVLVLAPLGFFASLVGGVVAIVIWRYVSLGSIVGAVIAGAVVVWYAWTGAAPPVFYFYGTLVPAFVIVTHRGNIKRLLSGTERKFSIGSSRQ
jgi:acyl phosphate:glycerol-3-phosphate acyltransferase